MTFSYCQLLSCYALSIRGDRKRQESYRRNWSFLVCFLFSFYFLSLSVGSNSSWFLKEQLVLVCIFSGTSLFTASQRHQHLLPNAPSSQFQVLDLLAPSSSSSVLVTKFSFPFPFLWKKFQKSVSSFIGEIIVQYTGQGYFSAQCFLNFLK